MTEPVVSPAAAADALAEVHIRRDQAIAAALVPDWYWLAVGGLMVAFTAAVESRLPWLIAVGSIAYALGLAAVVVRVAVRHRAQVHHSLLGVRGAVAIAGYACCLVALGLIVGFAADGAGVGLPATVGAAATAGAMTATGPVLMRYLRGMMTARSIAAGR